MPSPGWNRSRAEKPALLCIKDEDKAGKLCAAFRAQLDAWGKAMEGTA